MILGIDEVGRGSWAGPLVVGAVVLNGARIDGLTDSKKLSKTRREELYEELLKSDAAIGLGWVHADELDDIGLSKSLVEATKRAVANISVPYHEIIIDGTVNFLADTAKGSYVTTMKKADLLIASVSAASIAAKVARDVYMETQHEAYPLYGFDRHMGYGTAAHRQAIDQHGLSPLHRRSFGPLKSLPASSVLPIVPSMTAIGNAGEDAACDYLEAHGYTIVDRNWKTRMCEIDVIAKKADTYYMVEVKHRRNASAGDGVSAITPKKLKQMIFAARMYIHFRHIDAPIILVAIATTGEPAVATSYIEIE